MKIAISGASGMIGSALSGHLQENRHEILPLVRFRSAENHRAIYWSPQDGEIDTDKLEGTDAVVHLAGENLFGLWTKEKKQRIEFSRIEGTKLLSTALASLSRPPRILISASAVGYYGDRGDKVVDEQSPAGSTFLARVCERWEAATEPARAAGIQIVTARFGIVLSDKGGMLKTVKPLFQLGLGGILGSGDQYMSWISLADLVRALDFLLREAEISRAVNLVTPQPVTNRIWTKSLASVLHRPAIVRVPAFAIRTALGQMGYEMTLASERVAPGWLLEKGFEYRYPDLRPALEAILS